MMIIEELAKLIKIQGEMIEATHSLVIDLAKRIECLESKKSPIRVKPMMPDDEHFTEDHKGPNES